MANKDLAEYGLIGNMYTTALISTDACIDWYCLPNFDSPSIFGALLDDRQGGYFSIGVAHASRRQQFYYPDSNVLITRFLTAAGVGEINDFMPLADMLAMHGQNPHLLMRRVSCVRGEMTFRLKCYPAFNYARDAHTVRRGRRGVVFQAGTARLGLVTPFPLQVRGQGVDTEFVLREGETITVMLNFTLGAEDPLAMELDADTAFADTIDYWRRWIAQSTYTGRWREYVNRSALVLKLLTFAPSGAMVAAPTTSLPEELGGERNWDYRYTWIRDTSFSLYALLRIGFRREASDFMNWITARCSEPNPDGSLQVMYCINGGHRLPEEVLGHLAGYAGSRPVRVGNQAVEQLQLDIYGELMDAIYLFNKHAQPISYGLWVALTPLIDWVCENWQQPDDGIWEVRGGRQHFVYSKVMCWVALDRALRLAEKRSFPADLERWRGVRDQIYNEVMSKGWNRELQTFVQHYDTKAVDASLLIMPLVYFMSPQDPRMESTLDFVMRNLVSDSLVFRYRGDGAADGLNGKEGTFSMCTFWLVEALTRAGRVGEARLIFEKMLSYANHLGLYSEQISPTGDLLGNFPQAFTHFALISAAFNLDRALNKPRN